MLARPVYFNNLKSIGYPKIPVNIFGVCNNKIIISASKGFTLVELMVVISVIALLAAIGIVSFSSASNTTYMIVTRLN